MNLSTMRSDFGMASPNVMSVRKYDTLTINQSANNRISPLTITEF